MYRLKIQKPANNIKNKVYNLQHNSNILECNDQINQFGILFRIKLIIDLKKVRQLRHNKPLKNQPNPQSILSQI